MLPARREAISDALASIESIQGLGRALRIRAGLDDGTVVEGALISATPTDIAIQLPGSRITNYGLEQIRSLALGRPHRGRQVAVAGIGLAGGAAILAGLSLVPGVRALFEFHSDLVVRVAFYAGIAGLIVLLGTTRLRSWLVRWETLVEENDPTQ